MRVFAPAILACAVSASPAAARFSCDQLWGQRNAVYAQAGYCFKTAKAIRAFGNAGCKFDEIEDVPLSANERRQIQDIVRQERENGCPR